MLAAFLQEGKLPEEVEEPESTSALDWIQETAAQCQRDEGAAGFYSPNGFWTLSTLWVSITKAWLAGEGLSQLATTYGLFEGNIQRGLLRVASLLEEWGAIATLRSDIDTLEKLSGLRLLRDEVIVDSLYLRL